MPRRLRKRGRRITARGRARGGVKGRISQVVNVIHPLHNYPSHSRDNSRDSNLVSTLTELVNRAKVKDEKTEVHRPLPSIEKVTHPAPPSTPHPFMSPPPAVVGGILGNLQGRQGARDEIRRRIYGEIEKVTPPAPPSTPHPFSTQADGGGVLGYLQGRKEARDEIRRRIHGEMAEETEARRRRALGS